MSKPEKVKLHIRSSVKNDGGEDEAISFVTHGELAFEDDGSVIISYDELIEAGSYNAAKEKGLIRSEGKEYVMKDGDVTLFRFNV